MTQYRARWILPISAPPIRDGIVAEHDGRITYVGARSGARRGDGVVDLGDVLLMPGLVNTHCHLELTAMRGFLEGVGFREWLLRLTAARRGVLTQEMMLDAARLGVEEGLQYGITTFADTGDSGAGFDAMLARGVRGICYREVFGPEPAQCDEAIEALAHKVAGMLARTTSLVEVGVSPHAPYSVSDDLFRATAALARTEQLPLAVHIAESALETRLVVHADDLFADGLRARGIAVVPRARSPIALLESLGVLDTDALLIHCVHIDERDVDSIVRHDCAVAHCPASNAKLGHGIAPVAELLAAAVRVGLGSDSMASNNRMDVLGEARLAALLVGARAGRTDTLLAERALRLATIDGARALGLDAEIGTLDVGKAADFAAFPCSGIHAPTQDPIAAAVFTLAGTQADFVAVAGRVKVRAGRLVDTDPSLAARVEACAERLHAWLGADAGRDVTEPKPAPSH